ncbi:MAG: molecular chaperone DnaK [Deltaproteobacteria bacterium]|nr:molecular chaperone DnaK [Deltaproteobacteria bacterium]
MGKVIGIDLGTTNSVVAYMDRREPRVIINEEGGRVTPSVVGFSKANERFVGDIAKRQLLINPDATIHSVKRFMGKRYKEAGRDIPLVNYEVAEGKNGDVAIKVGGRLYSPPEISAMILQKLKRSAEDFLGEPVTEVIITVPAHFNDRQRQATKDAGTIAGLNVLRIINEPTAAALAYLHDRRKDCTIAVYDFGGGTFDISIVNIDRDVGEVRATRGNNALGGGDIDRVVVDWLLEQFRTEHGIDASGDKIVRQRLRDAAERAKIELSTATETEIHLPFLTADAQGPRHLQVTLTRAAFENMAVPLFENTIDECRKVLAESGLRVEDIEEVVMVGGSSRIPRVKEMVKEFFKRPLNHAFNPDEVVAIGAAIQAGVLEGEVKSVTLLDVTNLSLGIEVEGRRFAKLIPKNTTIPTQKIQMVSTVVDDQHTVKIHVLQGESGTATDNVSLGEFELVGLESAPRGAPRIEVKFAVDASGFVHVSARDGRGVQNAITIRAPTGMSKLEIEQAKSEASVHERRREEAAEVKDSRGTIEKQMVALETFLREHKALMHKQDVAETEQALKRGRMALAKSTDKANIDETSNYLKRFSAHLSDKLGVAIIPIQ